MTLGKYIVIQRRKLPFGISLNRTWDEHKNGFGDMNGDFFLGLEKLYRITTKYSIRIQIRTNAGKFSIMNGITFTSAERMNII